MVAKLKKYPKTKAGDELTPEVLEALAEEAERGYDLSKAKRVFVTRPLLPDSETMGEIVIRVTNEELNRLSRRAKVEDRRISNLVHEAAMQYLESKGA
jgi:succinate dehydrogenase/fumarate reductase flavoprotein subunit